MPIPGRRTTATAIEKCISLDAQETYIYTDRDNVGYVNKFTVFKSG